MTSEQSAFLFIAWLPLVIVWVVVMVDLIRRSPMSRAARLAWGVACTFVWPAMIAYLLIRPTRGRLEVAPARHDPRARLIDAALDHEAGRLDDAAWVEMVGQLRGQPGQSAE